MSILQFFILSIISVSLVQSDPPQKVMCAYGGATLNGTFTLEDVPPGCEAIIYGISYFNVAPVDADTTAITALKGAGKIVYMVYTFKKDVDGTSMFTSDDLSCLYEYIVPMLTYLKEKNIDGVILGYLGFHDGKVPGFDSKINALVCKIKECLPSIKVGLWFFAYTEATYTDNKIFDYTVTNDNVDVYIIDSSMGGTMCDEKTRETGGLNPITSIDPNIISLDILSKATSASSMDQTKVVVNLADSALKDNPNGDEFKTYSEYCCRTDDSLWCADSIELLYKQVIYLKKVYKGIVINNLESDDTDDSCHCGKYVVANTFIDAWEGKPMKCCDKLS